MNFWEYETEYDTICKIDPIFKTHGPEAYYNVELMKLDQLVRTLKKIPDDIPFANRTAIAQKNWYKSDKLYYKVWPEMIPLFCKASLKIPVRCLDFDYSSMLIRLPTNQTALQMSGYPVRSMLIWNSACSPEAHGFKSILLYIDFGELYKHGEFDLPLHTHSYLPTSDLDKTLEEVFDEMPIRPSLNEGVPINLDEMKQCWRLALCVSFMAKGNSRIIEPDVLNSDFEKYLKNPESGIRLQEKARRRGKYGFLVGRKELFDSYKPAEHEHHEGGNELNFAHWRNGHPALQWYGSKDDRKAKVIWRSDTVVRPDLPFKPKN